MIYYIQKVIDIMKFATRLDLGILGGPDSTELWQKIIGHIEIKPNMKFLNIACGHGTESKVLARALVSSGYYTKEQAMDAIYLIDKYGMFLNNAKSVGFKNVNTQDFLAWETDMKFDVVFGNPPYQSPNNGNDKTNQGGSKKLYVQFMEKSSEIVKDEGIIAMITPSAVFKTTVFGEYGKGFGSMHGTKLVQAETNVSEHFNVGSTICYWIVRKTDDDVKCVINGEEADFNKTKFYANDSTLQSIAEKILTNEKPITIKRDKDLGDKSGLTTSRYAYLTFGNTAEDTNLVWEHENPDVLKRFLKTNLFARVAWDGFVILDKRWYHNFWSALYIHPDIDVDMTDDEIMDLYGLTQEEKDIINSKDTTKVIKD